MQQQTQYFVGIDIGTTAVRCVIGILTDGDETPSIVGVGKAENLGMRKGSVVTIPEVTAAIDSAVGEAERTAGHKVIAATINVNGSHITGINSKGVIAVSSANKEISLHELDRVEEAATVVQLPPNREIIHVFPKKYRLDGQDNIKDPLGMHGIRLEVDAHVITASTPSLKNLYKTLDGAGISINNRILSGLASSDAVLNRAQKENGVVLVDIGGGSTNIAVYEEGDLQHVAVLPIGSINITNDLAIGLKTDLDIAEQVKIEHGTAIADKAKKVKVKQGSTEHMFDIKEIEMVIQARLDEIFELVDKELARINRSGKLPGGVVLVGGGSKLDGISEYAKEALKLPARVAHPSGFSGVTDTVNDPEYSAAIGLMLSDSHAYTAGSVGTRQSAMAGLETAKKKFKSFVDRFRP